MVEANAKNEAAEEEEEESEEETPEQEDARKKSERERLDKLQQPLIDDKHAYEATLTEEEKQAYEEFENTLRQPEEDNGDEPRDAF